MTTLLIVFRECTSSALEARVACPIVAGFGIYSAWESDDYDNELGL